MYQVLGIFTAKWLSRCGHTLTNSADNRHNMYNDANNHWNFKKRVNLGTVADRQTRLI
jgi:hypothetical protein